MSREALLKDLAQLTPQQPATVLWRVIELDHLLRGPLPDGLGLDVGCGDGTIVSIIRRHGSPQWRLVGVDPDPRETALAERSGEYDRVHTRSASEVPESDASFDFALSNSVLEHIPDVPAVLAEVARLLKPGAPFLATVPTADFNSCLRGPGVLSPLLGRARSEYVRGVVRRMAHVNLWDEGRWQRELRAVGLELEAAEPYLRCDDVRRWERISNWTAGILYGATGGRWHPIEITRSLDIQSGSSRGRYLSPLTLAVVRAALRGSRPSPIGSTAAGNGGHGCLLLRARKPM